MGLFDAIKGALNPYVINSFDDLYRNHHEALSLYVHGGYENYIDKIFQSRLSYYLSPDMPYEQKKFLVDMKSSILDAYNREIKHRKAMKIYEQYPNGTTLILYKKYSVTIKDAIDTAQKAIREYNSEQSKLFNPYSFILDSFKKDQEKKPEPQIISLRELGRFVNIILDNETDIINEEKRLKSKVDTWNDEHNQSIIRDAKSLARWYPKGYKEFVNFPTDSMSLGQAKTTLEYEHKIKQFEKLESSLNASVSRWKCTLGIPLYFFYYYFPYERCRYVTSESDMARKLVWKFKDGESYARNEVVRMLKKKLLDTFTKFDLEYLTLVCIPASTVLTNRIRYESFSNTICKETGMINAFNQIRIIKEKTEAHLGGNDKAEYSLDRNFFKNKNIILFDDVVTRGRSMIDFKSRLESLGAKVICAISIGRTCASDNTEPHPWSGSV